ncbi:hypothetical protein SAMN04489712_105295 [Thermomonospora echinospora]|uniref:Uncharacterized protein n=1 Tax=Thermomonospora echinospora TaxID=1992 RepID=A0A1H6A999_9ACTN|nr:hypothetical protein [Thermomonospora echinospora]SEG45303.1 hypothetical protein SAMN04489712_105295 [Thermomonospora echinospora]
MSDDALVYRVDAAPPERWCEAAIHGDHPIPAVVRTPERELWCAIHWWPREGDLKREGWTVEYSPAAQARLALGRLGIV